MKLLSAPRDSLVKPLSIVSGIVERRSTMPIMSNVLIQARSNEVEFLTTDNEMQISTAISLETAHSDLALTVGARKLLEILKSLPDTNAVTLDITDTKLSVQSSKSRFALQTLLASEFPLLKEPEEWSASITISQKEFKHLLNMVHFSMALQDIRYYLNGMLFVLDQQFIRVVATDGHRLGYCAHALPENFTSSPIESIIPRKTVLELLRLLDDSDEPISIQLSPALIRFQFNGITLISKLVDGKFPEYQRVIPQGYMNSFLMSREELQKSLQRAAILTPEKLKGVRITIDNNVFRITASNTEQEEAVEEIDVTYSADPLDIGFNVSYLLDVLANIKSEKILVSVGDANSSALISLEGSEDFKYVVMPMRI